MLLKYKAKREMNAYMTLLSPKSDCIAKLLGKQNEPPFSDDENKASHKANPSKAQAANMLPGTHIGQILDVTVYN